jgi:tRNA pseudouridine32 synthase/23S rRNA pseudouridine746 synthase
MFGEISAKTPLTLLADNPRWLVVDKPSGIASIPARDEDPADSLRHRLQEQLGVPLWVVHRIDRETSGAIIYARDAEAHRALNLAFQRGQVGKTYLAWTAGVPESSAGRIDTPMHHARKGKMRPAQAGEPGAIPASTDYAVEQQWSLGDAVVARVRCHPRTGRQHQIRVHLRSIGCPILRDGYYGLATFKPPFAALPIARLALHAAAIDIPRVLEQPAQHVEAPLAPDLVALQAQL